ncbi:hypothetical protein CDAR_56171 [Caerostris darwini]|uniref:Uncharacterized protein n=1 Tax=Caerostris darwini TaxID=1538125 RepID=A0AAV4RP15_9ARAC|nr:hypothetical protein CDAR_56171 [Caerostris darwini]
MQTLGLPYDEIVAAQKYCDVDSLLTRVQKRIGNEEESMRKALKIIASVHGVHRLRREILRESLLPLEENELQDVGRVTTQVIEGDPDIPILENYIECYTTLFQEYKNFFFN